MLSIHQGRKSYAEVAQSIITVHFLVIKLWWKDKFMLVLLLHFKLQAMATIHKCLVKKEKKLTLQVKDMRKTMFWQW